MTPHPHAISTKPIYNSRQKKALYPQSPAGHFAFFLNRARIDREDLDRLTTGLSSSLEAGLLLDDEGAKGCLSLGSALS